MDSQTIISVLTYGLLTVAGLLLAALVWFLNRTVSQLDKLAEIQQDHNERLRVLEDWREMVQYRQNDGTVGYRRSVRPDEITP